MMDTQLDRATTAPEASQQLPTPVLGAIKGYAEASKSKATIRAYRSAWRGFTSWCQSRNLTPMPADPMTIAGYLADRATMLKVSSLELHLVAIGEAHRLRGLPTPTTDPKVTTIMKGVRRTHGRALLKKEPVLVTDIKAILSALPTSLQGRRDAALLLLGFGAALRRSELVGLDVADLEFKADGVVAVVRQSKTDQEAEGHRIGVGYGSSAETCPVVAVRRWMSMANITQGPIFRPVDRHGHVRDARLSPRAVARIVKRVGETVGLDPSKLSGHSLRAGFATSAARAGLAEREIAKTTRHKSMAILRGYIREGEMFDADATRRLGL